jgi:hypothetical protein
MNPIFSAALTAFLLTFSFYSSLAQEIYFGQKTPGLKTGNGAIQCK